MFQSIRTVHADVLTSLPDNVTDLRLFKVWVTNATKGIELRNSGVLGSGFLALSTNCSEGKILNMNWKCVSDANYDRFEVQKSLNAGTWKIIGNVNAQDSKTNYSFTDSSSIKNNLYRVVAYDNNSGNKTISSVVISSCSLATTFNVFPNPVIDEATVIIQATESAIMNFKLFDSRGAVVKTFETSVHTGPNEIKVNTEGLARGSYILQAAWSGKIASNKLIKN